MPEWLLWLTPVPVATLAAIGWTAVTARRRGAARASESVQAYERFRTVMQGTRDQR